MTKTKPKTETKPKTKTKTKPKVKEKLVERQPSVGNVDQGAPGVPLEPVKESGTLIPASGQQLLAPSAEMAVNIGVQINADELVRLPMRKFKDECENAIRELTSKHTLLKTEAETIERDINVGLMGNQTLRDGIAAQEIKNMIDAFKGIGIKCQPNGMTHVISVENAKVKFTVKLKWDRQKNTSYSTENELEFERVLTAKEAGVDEQFTRLKKLRKAIAKVEEMSAEWRRKYGTIRDVEERFRCQLTEAQLSRFEGGMDLVNALSAQLMNKELKDMPRLEEDAASVEETE